VGLISAIPDYSIDALPHYPNLQTPPASSPVSNINLQFAASSSLRRWLCCLQVGLPPVTNQHHLPAILGPNPAACLVFPHAVIAFSLIACKILIGTDFTIVPVLYYSKVTVLMPAS